MFATREMLAATESSLRASVAQNRDEIILGMKLQKAEFQLANKAASDRISELNASLTTAKQDLSNALAGEIDKVKESLNSQKAELSTRIDTANKAIDANKVEFEKVAKKLSDDIKANSEKITATQDDLKEFKKQVEREKAALEKAIVESKISLANEMKALIKKTDEDNRADWKKQIDAVAAEAKADSSKNAAAIDSLRAKSLEIVEQIVQTNSRIDSSNASASRMKADLTARIEEAAKKSADDLKSTADSLLAKMAEADAAVRDSLGKKIDSVSKQSAADLKSATLDLTLNMKIESVNMQLKMAALTEQILKVDEEGRKRVDNLSNKVANDISNVRGEFAAKINILDSAVKDTRETLNQRLTDGLANLAQTMEGKLAALDGKITKEMREQVSKLTADIGVLEKKVIDTETKLITEISSAVDTLRKDTDTKYNALSMSLNAKIDTSNTILQGRINDIIEAQRKAEADAARQVAIILEKMAQQDNEIAAYDARLAKATAEAKVAIELEKSARAAELKKLNDDLSSLNAAQDKARAQLEADLTNALAGTTAASATEIANLKGALAELDNKTIVTVGTLKDKLAKERQETEAQILAATIVLEKKLVDAVAETQKVAARVEAVAQAQEEFKAYIAKNYATKGELLALQARVEGLEDVTKIMNADMIKSSAEMKALISKEVDAAKTVLTERIQKVEANVDDVRNKLGGAIDDYTKQIAAIKDKLTSELDVVRADMKNQDAALFAEIAKNKEKQDAINADMMLNVKVQAANFETLSQNVKKELSDKIVELDAKIDQTNAELKAEKEAVQKKFAEAVAAEQALKDQMTKELTALKDKIKEVEKTANQSLAMAQQNAEDVKLIKADIEEQKKLVAEKFKLTDAQLTKLNDDLKAVKEDFNKRLGEVAANAEKLVANLGTEVQNNFKKVATDIAQMKAQDKAMQSALSGHLIEVLDLKLDDVNMTAFSDGVSSDFGKVTKSVVDGKTVKGPLVTTLELFAQVRRNFLQALQPKMPTRSGDTLTRNEAFDKSFEPHMVACGGRADADFANAYGRDSFDFLADEYISNLIAANRGTNMDSLFFKQPKLTDGSSLHHYVLLEAVRKLEGASDDPQCVSKIKAWAADVLGGTSEMSKDVRNRLTAHAGFQRAVADFAKAVSDLKAPVDAVEFRFAKQIDNRSTTISASITNMTNPKDKLGNQTAGEASNKLLSKMAVTMSEGVDATFEAIQRQEEFDQMVDVQKRFAQNEADEKKQNDRLSALDKDVGDMKKQLEAFGKTANEVKAQGERTTKIEGALSKALDVMLSLAIRSGHGDLVEATKIAGAQMGYAPKEISSVNPQISEVQHFFAAPALANSSDACTGNSIKRGAGVKFWTLGGQCWVNFRGISTTQWASASSTIWFRVFGAADRMTVRSNLCDKGANSSCNAEFKFIWGAANANASGGANVTAKMTGSPVEGVFDIRVPDILEPYLRRSQSWSGEQIYFTPYGGATTGSTSTYTVQLYSPLVLDFTNVGRPLFSSMDESKVRFDLNGDGVKERTGWIGGYGGVGLLALDLNGNGGIDNGLELFGEGTRIVSNGRKARDGYAALAQYDANKDGVIDAKDPMYRKLVVWFDKNKDGVSDKSELVSLADSGVTKIGLKFTRLTDNERFVNGNEIRYAAKFWGPSDCGKAGCSSYDVYFSTGFTTAQKRK
jgi:hypothetical protein